MFKKYTLERFDYFFNYLTTYSEYIYRNIFEHVFRINFRPFIKIRLLNTK